jgi:arylsulfatase A-like enzyme
MGADRKRRFFLAAWIVFAAIAIGDISCLAADAPVRTNIVLFLADDLGWADVPWHGSQYKMPHLAALAQESVKLESHYVHPMCSPTRAAFMTGRFASRFGVTAAQNPRALRWNTVTLASALKSTGYETAITGKWHLGSKPEEGPQKFGFDHGYGSLAGGCGPLDHRYKEGEFTHTWHRDGKLIEEDGHITDLIAHEAVEWLEARGNKPFFLYVPFTAIHVPMLEPEKWQQMNAHLADPAQRLRAACASHMDDAVGQVLAVLERKKLRENTLVLFFGDNGAHPPSDNQGGAYPGDYGHLMVGNDNKPLRGFKSGIYEGGIRTPGLACWRGKLTAGETQTPIHAVDWMPTLCALTGAKPAGDLKWDGTDIWPAISQPAKPLPERTLYTAAPGFRAQAVRHGDWKLIVTKNEGKKANAATVPEELYNLASDLGETTNLASQRPDVLAQMKQRLAEISARDRDAVAND